MNFPGFGSLNMLGMGIATVVKLGIPDQPKIVLPFKNFEMDAGFFPNSVAIQN